MRLEIARMPVDANEVKLDFKFGERRTYSIIPFSHIESLAPSCPGLYSWQIRIKPECTFEAKDLAHEFFLRQKLNAKIWGNLRFRYEGLLTKNQPDCADCSNDSFLADAFVAMSLPLYIGISLDLQRRLQNHKDELNKFVQQFPSRRPEKKGGDSEADTEEESRNFARRIGKVVLAAGKKSLLDLLYVKVVRYPSVTSPCENIDEIKKNLLNAENYFNTLFNPVFGRR